MPVVGSLAPLQYTQIAPDSEKGSGLIALMLCGLLVVNSSARADELTDACMFISSTLHGAGGELQRGRQERFDYAGRVYKGCVVTVVGDTSKMSDKLPPAHAVYPYAGSAAAKAGWKADNEADGPDGTSFRIFRDYIFCAIEGWWDGGDDADPSDVAPTLYLVSAKCARLK